MLWCLLFVAAQYIDSGDSCCPSKLLNQGCDKVPDARCFLAIQDLVPCCTSFIRAKGTLVRVSEAGSVKVHGVSESVVRETSPSLPSVGLQKNEDQWTSSSDHAFCSTPSGAQKRAVSSCCSSLLVSLVILTFIFF